MQGVGLSTKRGIKTVWDPKIGAGTRQDNKAVKVPKEAKRGDKQVGDPKQDKRGAGDLKQKPREGCNAEVTRPPITWPTDLILRSYLVSN